MKSLIYLDPEALFYIMEKEQVVAVTPGSEKDKPEAALVDAGSLADSDYNRNQQDGVEIYLSKKVSITHEQQLEIRLKKGWLGRKLLASVTEKQSVPGFMGTRGC
ncbi:MAG: hypothetical protein LAT84_08245 [Balneolia bacterium]|nr:hypothetical protein [Balneolia bacterium]